MVAWYPNTKLLVAYGNTNAETLELCKLKGKYVIKKYMEVI